MKQLFCSLACIALLAAGGCKGRGGSNPIPITLTVQVRVTQSGAGVAGAPVTESTGYDTVANTPTGVLATKNTDITGTTSFSIGNPNTQYCFSSRYTSGGITYTPFTCQSTVTPGTTYTIGT